MEKAAERGNGASLDLVSLNTLDIGPVFRKRGDLQEPNGKPKGVME
jgi:hypothetical protein